MSGYLLGIDIGTSGTKAILVSSDGAVVGVARRGYRFDTPKPGWVEQDPRVWWRATVYTVRKVLYETRIDPERIRGLSFSGQMHGTVFLDARGRPTNPAVIWADKRSSEECRWIEEKLGREGLIRLVANPVTPGFMAATLLWMKRHQPQVYHLTKSVLLPKDYVRYRFTGVLSTDVSDGSSTLLFDVLNRNWSGQLLELIGVSKNILPMVTESITVVGEVTREASHETGLKLGTPVVAGGGDQAMTAVGSGVVRQGALLSNIGTGGQLFTPIDDFRVDEALRIHTFCHAIPGTWHLQGAILSAGLSLRWFRERLAPRKSFEALEAEASSVQPGSGGLVFLPYLIGERSPHLAPLARGVFVGLTYDHTRAHMVRAIMEGVGFALRDSLEVFRSLGVRVNKGIASGGGARSGLWRHIQADIFGMGLAAMGVEEQAALGAAITAGVGIGFYTGLQEGCASLVRYGSITEPMPGNTLIYDRIYRTVYRELYGKLKDDFRALSLETIR